MLNLSVRSVEVRPGRNFCFTLNNPPDSFKLPDTCKYIYQIEEGESGTPHAQGYIEFPKVFHLSGLKKFIPGAHWENRKGTQMQAYQYCMKEEGRLLEPVFNFVPEETKGSRTDLSMARPRIVAHRRWRDVVEDPELEELLAKYPKWVRSVYDHKPIPPVENVVLRPWQTRLVERLQGEPHPRRIIWVTDSVGNVGKSFLAKYLATNLGACVLNGGKSADVAYLLDNPRIVVWDLSRTQEEQVNYGLMESVKNGLVFSPKYESCVKVFPVPHVVVFCNFGWPGEKFSADRKCVFDLDGI